MKKILLIILLSIPTPALALNISLSKDIKKDCFPLTEIDGCYISTTEQIYINVFTKDLAKTFFHEYGHYLMRNLTEKEYRSIKSEINNGMPLLYWKETLATWFSMWMRGQKFDTEINKFFIHIIK
jgi:hypothetical protein